jgi:hypothetical protein
MGLALWIIEGDNSQTVMIADRIDFTMLLSNNPKKKPCLPKKTGL